MVLVTSNLRFYAGLPSKHSRECCMVECRIPSDDHGSLEGCACTVNCIFCAGDKFENCNRYSNSEAQDTPALSARCHGTFVKQYERSRLQQQNERHCHMIDSPPILGGGRCQPCIEEMYRIRTGRLECLRIRSTKESGNGALAKCAWPHRDE